VRPPKVSIRNVSRIFENGGTPLVALDGVSFDIPENEFTSLVGTSGCGKSTLLAIVCGLDEPTTGEIVVDGRPVKGPGRDRGMVFQSYTLFPWMTAQKNVEFALRAEPIDRRARHELAREQLALVGLDDFRDAYPAQLSGGMRQRVAIARALSYRPSVLLMDEPFGALDAQTRQLMQELLTRIWEQHRLTVLFVTHDIDEATFLSDRVLVMTARPGRIKDDVQVRLPRPRTFGLITTEGFLGNKARLLASVREESLRAGKAESAADAA
jgi:NitT/TauT family transport system ATP-binding protein